MPLKTVEQLNITRVGRYALNCELVHGANRTPLTFIGEDPNSNRGAAEFYDALEVAVQAPET